MAILACAVVTALPAQTPRRATSNAPFHKEPRGVLLGRLQSGARVLTGATQGSWIETTLEGFIWSRSVGATTRDGFDLAVTAGAGEVLRATPNGAVVARLEEGTLLKRVEIQGAWIKVRRVGWVAQATLEAEASAPESAPTRVAPAEPPVGRADPVRPPPTASADSVAGPPGGSRVDLRAGSEVAVTPDGARIATVAQSSDAEVIDRAGEWVKVRLEGWVRASDIASTTRAAPTITGEMVRANPDRYLGQRITWRLHFLAHQVGDDLRPEIPKGAPYLLTRGPLPETGFVYVTLSREQRDALQGLEPLDEIQIEGIIRAGRTRYLPTPVVELVGVVSR
jgi:hypothetical protein